MKWNNISVWQYQNIVKTLANKKEDEIEKSFKLIGIVYNMTENQVDSLTQAEYKAKLKECDFLNSLPEGKPVNIIKVNGKRYRLIYDVTRMPFGRYVESKAFVGDIYGNLHKLGATMVMPQKRNWLGFWIDDKYDASKHEDYADDILQANFQDVYFSLVFFYQVFRNWIEVTRDYLVAKMITTGQTKEQCSQVVANLCSILDGIIQPNLLPTTKISELSKSISDQQ
jgi:hypothetical protein